MTFNVQRGDQVTVTLTGEVINTYGVDRQLVDLRTRTGDVITLDLDDVTTFGNAGPPKRTVQVGDIYQEAHRGEGMYIVTPSGYVVLRGSMTGHEATMSEDHRGVFLTKHYELIERGGERVAA